MCLDSPSSRTPPFTCCYFGPSTVSSFIEYSTVLLFSIYFFELFFTIECKLPHSIDKLHPLAQVHVSLLITVQWYTVMTNFDNFEATWSHMLEPRPSNESYTSPLHCCTQTRQSFLFYRMISQVLVFLLTVGPCVTTVLTKYKLEYFAHARGINFTYKCNGGIIFNI